MKIIAIIQARTGSTRLPEKVLRFLVDKTVLAHVVERCAAVPGIHEVVVATSTNASDIRIKDEALSLGVHCYRGSEHNVLSRYYEAAKAYGAEMIIRITSDCPLIDPNYIQQLIDYFIETKSDYARIGLDRFPRGLDAEIFTMEALEKTYLSATSDFDKEHVTTYIQNHPEQFKLAVYRKADDDSQYRLTLDTPEDWMLIEKIYDSLYTGNIFYWPEVKQLLMERPELIEINAHVEQKYKNI